MCRWCGEFEAGMFAGGSDEFCSVDCIDMFDGTGYIEQDDVFADSEALASAGYGTDEDYGYYGGEDY